jgi:hypothetical protein
MQLAIAATVLASTSIQQVSGSYFHPERQKRLAQQSHHESAALHFTTAQQPQYNNDLQQLRRGNGIVKMPSTGITFNSQNEKQNQPQQSLVSDRKTKGRRRVLGKLINTDELAPKNHMECYPNSVVHRQVINDDYEKNEMMMIDTADIGILSCGVGRYCRESKDSSLGGWCVPLETSRRQRRKTLEMNNKKTPLGGNKVAVERESNVVPGGSSPTLFETITSACETTDYCDCSGFDNEGLAGTVVCTNNGNYCSTTANHCEEDVELCYTITSTLDVISLDEYTYTECIQYTKPYHQKVCTTYDTAVPTSCSVEFNNERCQSCETQLRFHVDTYERNSIEYTYSYNQRCFEFDCTNVAGGKSGNNCDRDIAPIGYNAVFGEDCEKCLICGLGYRMTAGDALFDFPVIGEYRCDGVDLASILGFFDREFCPMMQEAAFGPCGCEPIFYDTQTIDGRLVASIFPSDTPSSVPSGKPSIFPSDSPSAVPSWVPSAIPSDTPFAVPSGVPSIFPSDFPSKVPSWVPSAIPSDIPPESLPPYLATLAPDMDYVGVPCYICGDKDAEFLYPDAWLILPEGVSKCRDFANKALGNVFSED